MLQTSLRSVRALSSRPVAARQWLVGTHVQQYKFYADERKLPDQTHLPASETQTAASPARPRVLDSAAPASSTTPTQNVAMAPSVRKTVPTPAAPPPSRPPSPPRRRGGFFRRLRNYFVTLTLLGVLGFGGGVWYSRINDNFHDFFTEYVPFGERAVLSLEEADFRRRFPDLATRVTGIRSRTLPSGAEQQVTVPAQSGASWRVADSSERQSSSVPGVADKVREVGEKASSVVEDAKDGADGRQTARAKEARRDTAWLPQTRSGLRPPVDAETPVRRASVTAGAVAVEPAMLSVNCPDARATSELQRARPVPDGWRAPEVDEPHRRRPVSPIDPLKVNDATDPVVQNLVHMLNDVIAFINADGASDKYGSAIDKAKTELGKVGQKIRAIRQDTERMAKTEFRARVDDFDRAARQLVEHVEAAMASQEAQWRAELDAELKRLHEAYDAKVGLVRERERELGEQKARNKLLALDAALTRQFREDMQRVVEEERDGRLGRLEELSATVCGLEKLAAGCNQLVEASLRTQKLHVAVEAVRASLRDAPHARPFVRELVALRETASDDAVVDAAVASINPAAYQRGVPTAAELVERFGRVAGEVRKASLLPEDAGVASHASSWMLSKVMFKKQGLAEGADVESVLTRAQNLLGQGRLDEAAREMNGLTGWARVLSRDWLGEVRKLLEVQQALEVIQTEARLQSLQLEQSL